MVEQELDITGKVCPYCLLSVQKELKALDPGDVLKVKCDHPPAAKDNIPLAMGRAGHTFTREDVEPGLWLLTITKR